jgi:hypothetical protein
VENQPVTSDIPTLVMQGEYDPITPPAWGQHAAETLENGYFYIYPGVGHGAALVDGCPREMMLAFLENPTATPDDSCIAGMDGVSFIAPGAGTKAIEMEPFSDQTLGIRGLAPAGWDEVGPGAYVRGSSALDETALIMGAESATADALFHRLAEQIGFDPKLERVAQEEVGRFNWDFYTFELQGLGLDLALAEDESNAYFVLLASEPDERDTLYEQVFWPAIQALAPLPSTAPLSRACPWQRRTGPSWVATVSSCGAQVIVGREVAG